MEKLSGEAKESSDSSISREFTHIQGLRAKILNQVRVLSSEAGGKGSAKKDLNSQRSSFRDILDFLEVLVFAFIDFSLYFSFLLLLVMMILLLRQCQDGYPPETSIKIGGESLNVTSWSQLIQVPPLTSFGMWLPKLSASHSHFFLASFSCFL